MHDEPKEHESERQPEKAPAQGPPAPLLPAMPDTHSIILDKLINLRQMMVSQFNQMDQRIAELESTTNAIRVTMDVLQVAQPPPSSF